MSQLKDLVGPMETVSRRMHTDYGFPRRPSAVIQTSRAIWVLIGINTAVFGTWIYADYTKDRSLAQKLWNNTMLCWSNIRQNRTYTLLTSAFTHQNFFHFLFNMLSLNAFSSAFIFAGGVGVGSVHIFTLGIGAAVAGSMAWLYQQNQRIPAQSQGHWRDGRLNGPQVARAANGASGMVMGFGTAAALLAPFTRLMIIPLPVPLPMWLVTAGYMAYDAFYLSANDNIGRSAHLGGGVFGVLYHMLFLRKFGGVTQIIRHRMGR